VHPAAAQTAAFTTLALSQILHLGNARSRAPVMRVERALSNRYALGAVVLSVALQILATAWPPLTALLHVVPLDRREWALVAVLSAIPGVVGQIRRTLESGGRREGVDS
jgi:Ca2+-transporting ATPase